PVDDRGELHEVAPRPHDLVLRNLPARALRGRLSRRRRALRVSLQLVLRGRGAAARTGAPRAALAALAGRSSGLPPSRRRGRGTLAGGRGDARRRGDDRARVAPRAATSGAAADG